MAGFVFVDGVEEGVAGRAAVAVAEAAEESGVALDPGPDPLIGGGGVGVAVAGLEVIGDAEEDVDRAGGLGGAEEAATDGLERIAAEPEVEVAAADRMDNG